MTWQPIHTAPTKRTPILLYRPTALPWGVVDIGYWDDDKYAKKPRPYWFSMIGIMYKTQARDWEPTHWQPLPDHPPLPEEK